MNDATCYLRALLINNNDLMHWVRFEKKIEFVKKWNKTASVERRAVVVNQRTTIAMQDFKVLTLKKNRLHS